MFAKISGNVSKESIYSLETRRGFTAQKKEHRRAPKINFKIQKIQFRIIIIIIL